MNILDWIIIIGIMLVLIIITLSTRALSKSVVGFLAAGRCAGKYIICISDGMAALGAITIIGSFEMYYKNGFVGAWWYMLVYTVTPSFIALSGWILYRYRQTRVLTLAQFFEKRYSRNFRIFAGILAFVSGIINFGIFPAINARFFLYFCGFEPTPFKFTITMAILLGFALFFTYMGGQVAVIITGFLQGVFVSITFILICIVLYFYFSWDQIIKSTASLADGSSMLNPFKGGDADFNIWYYVIACFSLFYSYLAWQGNQAYNASAISPHEAKMGRVLGIWRQIIQSLAILLLPVCVYTIMHNSDFLSQQFQINELLENIKNDQIRIQMTVPIALRVILPYGLKGALCAVMLAAAISTDNAYLHSWGCIFIQDVIMPFRKKPFNPKQHLFLLKLAILFVALFVFFFSLIFRQTQYIFMFFAVTGAIFLAGAGSVIIGGLYWKRGTTLASYWAMCLGAFIALVGIILDKFYTWVPNGQWIMFIACIASIGSYIIISLIDRKNQLTDDEMDKVLNRGRYAVEAIKTNKDTLSVLGKIKKEIYILFGKNHEYTKLDRIIFVGTFLLTFTLAAVFALTCITEALWDIPKDFWGAYWYYYIIISFLLGTVATVWISIGGINDMIKMYQLLKYGSKNPQDDGWIDEVKKQTENENFSGAASLNK